MHLVCNTSCAPTVTPRGTRTAKIYSKILYLFDKFTVYYPRPELEGGRTFYDFFCEKTKVISNLY